MSKRGFYILDVFAEEKYSGNQLGVVCDSAGLSSEQMQEIAKEMNYSETTFILSGQKEDSGYDVRIFTPNEEVPFAGHPTLGTAYIIRNEIQDGLADEIILNLKVGQIPVTFDSSSDVLWMRTLEPVFGECFDIGEIAEVLSISKDDIDKRFPVQSVSTGLGFIIVPLRNLEAVKNVEINKSKLFEFVSKTEAKLIFVFCGETYNEDNDINSRMFADAYGIAEDAATGSANSCLAGYLVKHHYFGGGKIDVRVEQGYEIGRPSLLYLRAEEKDGKIDVSVGGKVAMVAKGELI
ncbi:MAG: PhzF family phenazine biosynthesis protein [Planctomycetes bacterium]|nr:PhzF family phenazine biosynthesis protein [Planctomycetota bacterium]